MKTLYFDIDGTILLADEGTVKPELKAGRFEAAVRAGGRLLAPDPRGDGRDIIEWLSSSSRTRR